MSSPIPLATDTPAAVSVDPDAEKRRAETRKLNAEAAKIENEAARLIWPRWREPAFWAAVSPVLLAMFTLLGAWVTGYFSAERSRLAGQTNELQGEKAKLEGERAKLEGDIRQVRERGKVVMDEFTATVKKLEIAADAKRDELAKLFKALQEKGVNVGEVQSEANKLHMKIVEIQQELARAKQKLAELPTFDPPPARP